MIGRALRKLAFRNTVRPAYDFNPAITTSELPSLSYTDAGLLRLPQGYLGGGVTTRATSKNIAIAAFQARDSTNVVDIIRTTAITKILNATWVAGSSVGGLNATDYAAGTSGAEPNTWYHLYVIKHTDNTVDAGFDKSTTASNLLSGSGYTYYRRVGSVLTDATAAPNADILAYTQVGPEFMWNVVQATLASNQAEQVGFNTTVFVPLGFSSQAVVNVWVLDPGQSTNVHIYTPTAVSDQIPSETAAPSASLKATTTGHGARMIVRTNTSSQIRANLDGPPAIDDFDVSTLGWIDDLGRYD
jgi:hypothetical protein